LPQHLANPDRNQSVETGDAQQAEDDGEQGDAQQFQQLA
jgi:hypothetical protein